MIEKLENEFVAVSVSDAGAELHSLYHKKRRQEYLWQGDAKWWGRRAPVLFPIVGKVNDGTFRVNGEEYKLPQHGFARDCEFTLTSRTSNTLTYVLNSSPELLKKYPYDFRLTISYRLEGHMVTSQYTVNNPGTQNLYFSVGGHPAFAVQPGEKLSDYSIEFEKSEHLDRALIREGLLTGETEAVLDGHVLDLTDDQAKKDAIVFKHMQSKTLVLKSRISDYRLTMQVGNFPYFGIWGKPGGPFVCLEPWCGVTDAIGFAGDFSTKTGIEMLAPGAEFERSFSVTLQD